MCDLILALALIHHLAIGNNIPLGRISGYLASLGETLLVEFVPKNDSQVRRMLSAREDVFSDYSEQGFEQAFSEHWKIKSVMRIGGTARVLYLMTKPGA